MTGNVRAGGAMSDDPSLLWWGNTKIEDAHATIADLIRRHGGTYVEGPAQGTGTKTAEQLTAWGFRGIYRETANG